jgi:hypothetical protein
MIIDRMDGFRVVFYCMILSYGRSSSWLSWRYVVTCYSLSILLLYKSL